MNINELKVNLLKKVSIGDKEVELKGIMADKNGRIEFIIKNGRRGGFDDREFTVKGLKAKKLLKEVEAGNYVLSDAPAENGSIKFADCDLIGKKIYLIQEDAEGKLRAFPVNIYGVLKTNHRYYYITDNFGRIDYSRYSLIRTVRVSYIKKHLGIKYLSEEAYNEHSSDYILTDSYAWNRAGLYDDDVEADE